MKLNAELRSYINTVWMFTSFTFCYCFPCDMLAVVKGPPHTWGKLCIQVNSSKCLKDMDF